MPYIDDTTREVRSRAAEILAAVGVIRLRRVALFRADRWARLSIKDGAAWVRAVEWLRIGMSLPDQLDKPGETAVSLIVPYVTQWTGEQDPPSEVIHRPGGIGYADEIATDRDIHGILWTRAISRPRRGKPQFGKVNPLRQRRAMSRLLCQVCGGPADQNENGILWLLQDHREDWPTWPEQMGNVEPPICRPCADTSLRLCPKLRKGAALVRTREHPLAGVRGALYQPGQPATEAVLDFDDPAIPWIKAVGLVRQLKGCSHES